jgi:hypothetical protein
MIVSAGEVDVSAMLQGVRGTAHVSVAPVRRGFDISGLVHESAPTESVLLSGATVGIHFAGCPSCPHEGQETTTDEQGRFALPGIETAGFTLWVRRPGYEATPFDIAILPRDQHPSVGLSPDLRTVDEVFRGNLCSGDETGARGVGQSMSFVVHRDGVFNVTFAKIAVVEGDFIRVESPLQTFAVSPYVFPPYPHFSTRIQGGAKYVMTVSGYGCSYLPDIGPGSGAFRVVFTHPN